MYFIQDGAKINEHRVNGELVLRRVLEMNVKRFLALSMAGLLAVTSVNTGSIKAYAQEPEQVVLESSREESKEVWDQETEEESVLVDSDNQEAEVEVEVEETEVEAEEDLDDPSIPDADSALFENDEDTAVEEETVIDDEDVEVEEDLLKANYSFTLDANGGVFPDGNTTYVVTTKSSNLTQAAYKPEWEGRSFKGWYADADCTELISESSDASSSDIYWLKETPENGQILYAGWSGFYTITYIFGTESGNDPLKNTGYYYNYNTKERVKELKYSIPEGSKIGSNYPMDAKNTNLHYRFDFKFYKDENRTEGIDSYKMYDVVPEGDTTYYVGYKDTYWIVTFHNLDSTAYFTQDVVTGGYVEPSEQSQTLLYTTDKGLRFAPFNVRNYAKNSNPRRAIDSFYYDSEATQQVELDDDTFMEVTGDIDLYIKWEDLNSVITFDANGGYFVNKNDPGDTSKKTVEFGHEPTLSEIWFYPGTVINPDRHMRFAGWSTDRNSTNPEYPNDEHTYDDDYYENIQVSAPGDTTYYAIWEKAYQVVTFNAGEGLLSYHDVDMGVWFENVPTATVRTTSEGTLRFYPSSSDVLPNDQNLIFSYWKDADNVEHSDYKELYCEIFDKDMDLTATYIPCYTITLDAGEGTFTYFDYEKGEEVQNVHSTKIKTDGRGHLRSTVSNSKVIPPAGVEFFIGWYDGSEKIEDLYDQVFTKDTTLKARYSSSNEITFVAEDGTFSYYDAEQNQYYYDVSRAVLITNNEGRVGDPFIDIKSNKDNYIFEGWYIGTEKIQNLYSKAFKEDTTVTAHFIPSYTIKVDAKGGTFSYYDEENNEEVENARSATLKTGTDGTIYATFYGDPEIDNASLIFDAWYSGSTRIEDIDEYIPKGNETIEAHYVKACILTLDANGGYFGTESTTTRTMTFKEGEELSFYLAYYKDDAAEFGGWYTDKGTWKNRIDVDGAKATKSMTVYARWYKRYKVTFDFGEGSLNGQTSKDYRVPEGQTFGSNYSIPGSPVPASDNKAFAGWFSAPDTVDDSKKLENSDILEYVVTEDKVFYAGYKNAYSVTFNVGEGKFVSKQGNTYTVKIADGEAIKGKAPTVVSTRSKVFEGWFTSDGNEISNIYSYKVTADTELFAHFADCYLITFHGNRPGAKLDGVSGDIVIPVVKGTAYRYGKDGTDKDVLFDGPELDYSGVTTTDLPYLSYYSTSNGKPQVGWCENEEGTGNVYFFGKNSHRFCDSNGTLNNYNMYGFVPTKDMDFYVKWAEPVYITFDANGSTFKDSSEYDQYGTLSEDRTQRTKAYPKGIRYRDVNDPSKDSTESREGYTIHTWACTDREGTHFYGSEPEVNENSLFYARWITASGSGEEQPLEEKKVTLHSGEGYFYSPEITTSRVTYHSASATDRYSTSVPTIRDEDKAFQSWYTDAALSKPYASEYQAILYGDSYYILIPKDITDLYAKFGTAYTVTVDANGGYFDNDQNRTKDPDEKMRDNTLIIKKQSIVGSAIEISDYTKRIRRDGNKIFGGWYTDQACTQKADITSDGSNVEYFVPKKDTTLFAKWIDYDLPEGEITASADKTTLKIGEKATLTSNTSGVHWYINRNSYNSGTDNPFSMYPIVLHIDGTVEARQAGTASVYAEYNGKRSALIEFTVTSGAVKPELTVDKTNVSIVKGENAMITASVTPSENDKKVTWKSSSESIVKVSDVAVSAGTSTATITAVSEGTAKITATCGSLSKTIQVTVTEPVEDLVIEPVSFTLPFTDGSSKEIAAKVSEAYGENIVTWESSAPSLLSVTASDDKGRKAFVQVRTATPIEKDTEVTVTASLSGTDIRKTCVVTVRPPETTEPVKAVIGDGKTVGGGVYTVNAGALVELKSETFGVRIFFTKTEDGSEPDEPQILYDSEGEPAAGSGTEVYKGAFALKADTTKIKAVAARKSFIPGEVTAFEFDLNKTDWGEDIESLSQRLKDCIKAEFGDPTKLEDKIWYVFGNETDGYRVEKEPGTAGNISVEYDGNKIAFNSEVFVFNRNKKLIENRDYTLTFANNINVPVAGVIPAKAPKVSIKGKGNYKIDASFIFGITPANMDNAELSSEKTVTILDSAKLSTVKPVVTYAGKKLAVNKDYELRYFTDQACTTEDPALTKAVLTAGTSYFIQIAAKSANFTGKKTDPIEVKVIGKADKSTVQVSKLKVMVVSSATGKAVKIPYDKERSAAELKEMFTSGNGEFAVAVTEGKTILKQGKDYTIEYPDKDSDMVKAYESAGKYRIVIHGRKKTDADLEEEGANPKNYIGDKTVFFEISGTPVSKAKVAGLKTTVEYTGAPISLGDLYNAGDKNLKDEWKSDNVPVLYVGTTKLVEGTNFLVKYTNTGIVGKFDLVYTGINGYSGTLKKTITVKAHDMSAKAADITVDAQNTVYVKSGAKPEVTVRHGSKLLVEGVDYTVTYKNNTKVFTDTITAANAKKAPTAVVKGMGNYAGSGKSDTFNIDKAPISQVKVVAADVVFDAKKNGKSGYFLVVPKLMDGGKAITAGKKKDIDAINKKTDYGYYYQTKTTLKDGDVRAAGDPVLATDQVPEGTTIRVEVKIDIAAVNTTSPYLKDTDKLVGYYRVLKDKSYDISRYSVQLTDASKLYFDGGDKIRLSESDIEVFTGKGAGRKVLSEGDYEIVSITGSNKVGNATIVIEGRGLYGGSKTATLKVIARVR